MEQGAVSKRKTYCCVVTTSTDVSQEELAAKLHPLRDLELEQDTPVRCAPSYTRTHTHRPHSPLLLHCPVAGCCTDAPP